MKVTELLSRTARACRPTICASARGISTIRCSVCVCSDRWGSPRRGTRFGPLRRELARVKTVLREKGVRG